MKLSLDERFITALVQRAISDATVTTPGVDVPRTQIDAALGEGKIVVRANVELLGQPTQGTVTLRPRVDAGRLRVEVVETNLGAIQLPAIDQLLETEINKRLQSLLDGGAVTVTDASVDPANGLVVACQVDLDALEHDRASSPAPARAPSPQSSQASRDPWATARP